MQAGTTSKTFFPGVRLGWAAGPAEVVAQLVSAKQNTDQCSGALGQRLFEEYARRGWIDEQLERVARALRAQRRAAARRARARDARRCRVDAPAGGFFSWLTVPGDAAELARRAADDGVAVVPGALFYPGRARLVEHPPLVQHGRRGADRRRRSRGSPRFSSSSRSGLPRRRASASPGARPRSAAAGSAAPTTTSSRTSRSRADSFRVWSTDQWPTSPPRPSSGTRSRRGRPRPCRDRSTSSRPPSS